MNNWTAHSPVLAKSYRQEFSAHPPSLQLNGPLFSRDLEAVRVVFIGGLLHLHTIHSYSTAHGETLANQAELRCAAQQEIVELDKNGLVVKRHTHMHLQLMEGSRVFQVTLMQ